MISASQIKFVRSLHQKKYRDLHHCFLAEGSKLVHDLSQSYFSLRQVYGREEWFRDHPMAKEVPTEVVKPLEMERITGLSSPSPVLAVVEMPEESLDLTILKNDFTLILDGIQDPGNMGTIIRIADWFGITQILCSQNCVDLYNPKVVQATMGSITRVRVNYVELPDFLPALKGEIPIYGMMLAGEDLYTADILPYGVIVIGSEAHGISEPVSTFITHKLSIPYFPVDRKTHAESLNAAVATGIVCAEFRKRLGIGDTRYAIRGT